MSVLVVERRRRIGMGGRAGFVEAFVGGGDVSGVDVRKGEMQGDQLGGGGKCRSMWDGAWGMRGRNGWRDGSNHLRQTPAPLHARPRILVVFVVVETDTGTGRRRSDLRDVALRPRERHPRPAFQEALLRARFLFLERFFVGAL